MLVKLSTPRASLVRLLMAVMHRGNNCLVNVCLSPNVPIAMRERTYYRGDESEGQMPRKPRERRRGTATMFTGFEPSLLRMPSSNSIVGLSN